MSCESSQLATGNWPLATSAAPLLAGLFGFLAFLPYPALPVGGHTAVQGGNILALGVAAVSLALPWRRELFMAPLILLPACLSLLHVALSNPGDELSLSFKSLLASTMSMAALLATQVLAPRCALALLSGIAVATVGHVVLGAWQVWSFPRGEFPLLFLYVNPSFRSVQEDAEIIMQYIRRPFGLFPEASAMSAALAPWVAFWFAHLLGLVRLRQPPSLMQKMLFAVAAAGGTGLIIASRSGHAAVLMVALLFLALLWLVRCRATVGSWLKVVAIFGVVMPAVLWLAGQSLGQRLEGERREGTSWTDRTASLKAGFTLLAESDLAKLVLGMGPGLLAPKVASSEGLEAVWSLSLSYLYQTGLIGAMVGMVVFGYLVKVWRRARRNAVLVTMFFVWFVGVTLTTSYGQLLPIWMALAWLSIWPEVVAGKTAVEASVGSAERTGEH